ncbi:hypothetical protein [Nannocystis radixulma]|uniref:Uncharacterized protein n=1 Tax=Nannocystis radixulma TaxID=2995305 RepID=A0ABT5AWW4_9BACT|nr:hypothetical protein [Nannocystis radixulma]MDC0666334.1 hypothetical protein [Nannocystis radixulma]
MLEGTRIGPLLAGAGVVLVIPLDHSELAALVRGWSDPTTAVNSSIAAAHARAAASRRPSPASCAAASPDPACVTPTRSRT